MSFEINLRSDWVKKAEIGLGAVAIFNGCQTIYDDIQKNRKEVDEVKAKLSHNNFARSATETASLTKKMKSTISVDRVILVTCQIVGGIKLIIHGLEK